MRRTIPVIAFTTLLLGCEQSTLPTEPVGGPSAQATVSRTKVVTVLPFTAVNSCTGETISFEATEITLIRSISDAAGGSRTIISDRLVASGESNTGNRYQAILVSQVVTTETVGETEITTVLLEGRLVGQGGGQNPTTDIRVHLTIVDGQPTAVVDVFELTCSGP